MACAAALGVAACGGAPPPTRIEQGQAVTTGAASYDELFQKVLDVRERASRAEREREKVTEPLRSALGLAGASDLEATIAAARARAGELKGKGLLLHLQLTPEVKLLVVKQGGTKEEAPEPFVKAVEEAVRGSIEVSRRLGELADRTAQVEKQRETLSTSVQRDFEREGKKAAELVRELDASKRVLEEARIAGEIEAGEASRLVLELASAIETGAVGAKVEPLPKGLVWRGKPGGKPAGKPGGKPAAGKPKKPDFDP